MTIAQTHRIGLLAGYGWMHAAGLAYCFAVAVWSASAYLSEGKVGPAIMCVGAQFAGLIFAILSRRAMGYGKPVVAFSLWAPALAGAWVAAGGIKHAYELQGGQLSQTEAFIVAALELVLFVAIDHIAEVERHAESERALKQREQLSQAENDALRERARIIKEFGEVGLRAVAGGSVIASGQALATPVEATVQAPASAQRAPMASTYTGYERPHDHVRALYEAGERSPTAIHKQVKALSRQRISAMLNQWQREADKRAG